VLKAFSRLALIAGAAASLVLMLRAGQKNTSSFLMVLFAGWVVLPFLSLGWADHISSDWTDTARRALQATALIVTGCSLSLYSGWIAPPSGAKTAFVFLMAPLISLPLIGLVAAYGASTSRKKRASNPPA
jgi:hypothetical protein